MGFGPLRRLRSREPVRPGLPHLARDACRVRALSTSFSPEASTALFHAAHALGVSPFGAFSFAKRETVSRRPLPLLPLAQTRRSFHNDARPASGACSLRKSVAATPSGPGARLDAPLGFFLFRGFLPTVTARGFPRASSHELGRSLLLRVSITSGPVRLRRDHRPS